MYATICGTLKFLKSEEFVKFIDSLSLFYSEDVIKEFHIDNDELIIIVPDSYCVDNAHRLVLGEETNVLSEGVLDKDVTVIRCFAEDICSCFEFKDGKLTYFDESGENSSISMILPEGTLESLYPDTSLADIINDITVGRTLDFSNNETDSELRELIELWLHRAVNPICDLFTLKEDKVDQLVFEMVNEQKDTNVLPMTNDIDRVFFNDTELPSCLYDIYYRKSELFAPIEKIEKVVIETKSFIAVFYVGENITEMLVVSDK